MREDEGETAVLRNHREQMNEITHKLSAAKEILSEERGHHVCVLLIQRGLASRITVSL